MNYKKFLGQSASEVLPYLGGLSVHAGERRLRVTRVVAPGWWRFRVSGRRAEPLEPAEPPDLSGRPRVHGHAAGGWLFASGVDPAPLVLPPAEELEPLAVVSARRWAADALLFEAALFDGDAEVAAREALFALQPIAELKGVAASLRAAFGWALLQRVAAELGEPVSLFEAIGALRDVANRGREAASLVVVSLAARRRQEHEARAVERAVLHISRRPAQGWLDRAEAALAKAGAELDRSRDLGDGSAEVHFAFLGERFIAVVDQHTLQLHDSGICLSGSDRQITLESLPSVIREAIAEHRLVITRRS